MTVCEAHGALLHNQCGEALPEPGQVRRPQVGVERRPAVIDLIEEDVAGRPLHLDDVELDRDLDVVELRREMERAGAPPTARAA